MITPIVWDKIVFKINKSTGLPISKAYYNERGGKTKELFYREPRDFGEATLPTVLEMKSYTNPGFVSKLVYEDLKLNIPVFPHLFTMRNLKNLIGV